MIVISINCVAQSERVPAADGNRYIDGRIDVQYSLRFLVPLSSTPTWVVGAGDEERAVWYVMLDNGSIERVTVTDIGRVSVAQLGGKMPGGTPLSLDVSTPSTDRRIRYFPSRSYLDNFLTYPVNLPADNRVAALRPDGTLVISSTNGTVQLENDFLPDGRILYDDRGRLLLLGAPSTRYAHGVLGDSIEPSAAHIVSIGTSPNVTTSIEVSSTEVFETLAPIWTDIDQDGVREIVTTVSSPNDGARLSAYRENGEMLAQSDPIGSGYRWMHLLAAAPTGPSGETEIIAVRTPHIGGILQYYRRVEDRLKLVHSVSGYSTHKSGSRNLDTAIAGDFNEDGDVEFLLPNQDFSALVSIERTEDGSEIDYTLYLDGKLTTNLSAFSFGDKASIALGTSNDELLIIFESF